MNLKEIETLAAGARLDVLGAFHPGADDPHLPGIQTLVMFGPREPGFWKAVQSSPEWQDTEIDPIDRWSSRVIGGMASQLDAKPFFPFGEPYLPFFTWALKTGRAFSSPVHLLVHDAAGLMVSFRGALGFNDKIALPTPAPSPCITCADKPCLTACPVTAITKDGYDVAACNAFLYTPQGQACMSQGCAVRRACPVSQKFGRCTSQSAYHMEIFRKSPP